MTHHQNTRPANNPRASAPAQASASRATPRHGLRLWAILPLGALTFGLVATPATATPSTDDVREARAGVARAQMSVAQLEVRLAELATSLHEAEVDVQVAAESYAQAMSDVEEARTRAQGASERATQAAEQAEAARRTLVALARQMSRTGGSADILEAALSADGFEEVARRTTALNQATSKANDVVQEYQAALLVAGTLERRSAAAAKNAEIAAGKAEDALAEAERVQQAADESFAAGQAEREQLIVALAAARQTSADVERARQDALDAEREARADAAAQAQRLQAQPSAPSSSSGSSAPATSRPQTPNPAPAAPAPSTPAPSTPAPSAPAPSTPAPNPAPAPTTPAPAPAPPAPDPAPPAPAPAPPAPAPAPPAPTTPYGLGTGKSRGSAAQGQQALEWAKTKIGLPYVWGGNGPNGYDCSGLTMAAWRAAGVNINRTSRDQYKGVLKISYDQLRPGDLVFWANNTNDPNTIYHVAMWAGNGQIMEASKPGVPLRLTKMRWAGTMPFAGRP